MKAKFSTYERRLFANWQDRQICLLPSWGSLGYAKTLSRALIITHQQHNNDIRNHSHAESK
jgi:hypothetical protein